MMDEKTLGISMIDGGPLEQEHTRPVEGPQGCALIFRRAYQCFLFLTGVGTTPNESIGGMWPGWS